MKRRTKEGAASFYVVAFSTLILMIIATSFAAIIISEVTRTMNDDLSQSAYDSAMAGIEDAKLAFYNYQNCLAQQNGESGGMTSNCVGIIDSMNSNNSGNEDCDMVAKMIGRGEEGVVIEESNTDSIGNNMQQAYTCVTMSNKVSNYWSTLSSSNLVRVFKAKFDDGVAASQIDRVKLSWFSEQDAINGKAYNNFENNKVVFRKTMGIDSKPASAPPTVSLAMIQTADTYTMSDFDVTKDGRTNRAMVYLVPTESGSSGVAGNHNVAANNTITAAQFAKSNDKTLENVPFTVACNGTDFACSATIELPKPIGGERNDDTFIFAIGLPYGEPNTEISLEFFGEDAQASCADEDNCDDASSSDEPFILKDVQIAVDSTGKANDFDYGPA